MQAPRKIVIRRATTETIFKKIKATGSIPFSVCGRSRASKVDKGVGLLVDVPSALENTNKNSVPVLKMIGFDGPIIGSNTGPHPMCDPLIPVRGALHDANDNRSTVSAMELIGFEGATPVTDVLPAPLIKPINTQNPAKLNESIQNSLPAFFEKSRQQMNDRESTRLAFKHKKSYGSITASGGLLAPPIRPARNEKVQMKANEAARKPLPALLKIQRPIGFKSTAARIIYQRVLSTDLTLRPQAVDCNIANPMDSDISPDFGSLNYSGESE